MIYPNMLYKYTKPEYAVGMTEQGTVMVGTLYDFRKEEKYGQKIGDASEGVLSEHLPVFDYQSETPHPDEDFIKNALTENLGIPQGSQRISITNSLFVQRRVAQNCYIYCTTSYFDADVMAEFGGACVLIFDPAYFFAVVTEHLHNILSYQGYYCVNYLNRVDHHHKLKGVKAALAKDFSYSEQQEVRAIWVPSSEPIERQAVSDVRLTKSCCVFSPSG